MLPVRVSARDHAQPRAPRSEGLALRDTPTLFHYASTPATLRAMAAELFDLVLRRKIQAAVRQTFALKDAADAHRALEPRETTGATVLLP